MKRPTWLQGKNARLVGLGLGSLLVGLIAAHTASKHIDEQLAAEKARLAPKQNTVQVVVARQDMQRGAPVTTDAMAVRDLPRDMVGANVVVPDNFEQYIGVHLAQPIKAGEPLLTYALESSDVATFAQRVKTGIRAITIGVDEISSVSGMIQPGDQIDLLWSVKPSAIAQAEVSQLEKTVVFMQGLPVLATGKQLRPVADDGRNRGYSTITVEATPAQAQRLVVAQRTGKLTAVLRNPQDQNALKTAAVDLAKLLDIQKSTAAPRPTTEIIVGGRGNLQKQQEITGQ
jgi:pilus assembly protein CpaB